MGGVVERELQVIPSRIKHFDVERYRNPLNRVNLPKELVSLMKEMEVMGVSSGGATLRQMVLVPGEGFFHEIEGEWIKYTEYFEKAIEDTDDIEVKRRFEAEQLGWERAEQKLIDSEIEMMAIASPPGEVYRLENKEPLSATFVLARGEEVSFQLEGREVEGVVFDAFALYVDEISVEEHLQVLGGVGEFVERLVVIDDLALVATPVVLERVIEQLDEMVVRLGFDNWDEMEKEAMRLNGVLLEGSGEQEVRRRGLIKMLGDLVDVSLWEYGKYDLDLVAVVIDMCLSKEMRGYYVDKGLEMVKQDIQLTLLELHKGVESVELISELGVDLFTYNQWKREQELLLNDHIFQRMMSAHGGGGIMVGKDQNMMSIDARTNQLMTMNHEKRKMSLKCGECGHSFESKTAPCDCPKCHKKVSKEGV